MASQEILNGELVDSLDQTDPDLNAAWWAFRDEIEKEQHSGGTIVVFEVPLDTNGIVRGRTLRNIRLFSVAVGTLTMDDICDRILEGFMQPGERKTFKLMGHIDGQRGIKLNKFLSLAKPLTQKALGHESELAQVLKTINDSAARDRAETRQLFSELLTRQATPAVDPLQFGMQMAEKLTALASALHAPQVAQAATLTGQPPSSMVEQMTQMMTMMAMMKKFFGGDAAEKTDNGESFSDIVKSVLSVAKPMIEAHSASVKAQASQVARLSAPVAPGAPVAPSVPEQTTDAPADAAAANTPDPFAQKKEENEMRLLNELKQALPTFIELATRNAPVKDTAQLALSSMPDSQELNDTLFGFLNDPDFFKRLTLLDPGVSPHAEWFENFRVALLKEFEPDVASAGGTD